MLSDLVALRIPVLVLSLVALLSTFGPTKPAQAADIERLEAFLEVTGFDVALESIQIGRASCRERV